jgi:hypothetical protein
MRLGMTGLLVRKESGGCLFLNTRNAAAIMLCTSRANPLRAVHSRAKDGDGLQIVL